MNFMDQMFNAGGMDEHRNGCWIIEKYIGEEKLKDVCRSIKGVIKLNVWSRCDDYKLVHSNDLRCYSIKKAIKKIKKTNVLSDKDFQILMFYLIKRG